MAVPEIEDALIQHHVVGDLPAGYTLSEQTSAFADNIKNSPLTNNGSTQPRLARCDRASEVKMIKVLPTPEHQRAIRYLVRAGALKSVQKLQDGS